MNIFFMINKIKKMKLDFLIWSNQHNQIQPRNLRMFQQQTIPQQMVNQQQSIPQQLMQQNNQMQGNNQIDNQQCFDYHYQIQMNNQIPIDQQIYQNQMTYSTLSNYPKQTLPVKQQCNQQQIKQQLGNQQQMKQQQTNPNFIIHKVKNQNNKQWKQNKKKVLTPDTTNDNLKIFAKNLENYFSMITSKSGLVISTVGFIGILTVIITLFNKGFNQEMLIANCVNIILISVTIFIVAFVIKTTKKILKDCQ